MSSRVAAIVLAGGAGRRMGGPKASLPFGGSTLVEHAVEIARRAGCDPVVVAVRADTPLPAIDDVRVVLDPPGDGGPLAAIAAALVEVAADEVVLLACDLPRASPVVQRLVARAPGARATVARDVEGRVQPLCMRVDRRRALTAATDALARGDRRVHSLVGVLDPDVIDAPGDELLNVNEPPDLARLAP